MLTVPHMLVAAGLTLAAVVMPLQGQTTAATSLLNDVKYLSSDSLAGRLTGTPGADSAAAYLARRFKQAGLRPTPRDGSSPSPCPPAPRRQRARG